MRRQPAGWKRWNRPATDAGPLLSGRDVIAPPALWFAIAAMLTLMLLTAWFDLKHLRIPNALVLAVLAVFLVAGFWGLPLATFLWRLGAGAAVLGLGFGLFAAGLASGAVVLFNERGRELFRTTAHNGAITALAFDGADSLLSAGEDGFVFKIDTESGEAEDQQPVAKIADGIAAQQAQCHQTPEGCIAEPLPVGAVERGQQRNGGEHRSGQRIEPVERDH